MGLGLGPHQYTNGAARKRNGRLKSIDTANRQLKNEEAEPIQDQWIPKTSSENIRTRLRRCSHYPAHLRHGRDHRETNGSLEDVAEAMARFDISASAMPTQEEGLRLGPLPDGCGLGEEMLGMVDYAPPVTKVTAFTYRFYISDSRYGAPPNAINSTPHMMLLYVLYPLRGRVTKPLRQSRQFPVASVSVTRCVE